MDSRPPFLAAAARPSAGGSDGQLAQVVAERHPQAHQLRSEPSLFDYVNELKARHMRSAPPLAKVAFDPHLERAQQALGTHSAVSRVQG